MCKYCDEPGLAKIEFGVLTALPEEFKAVKAVLKDPDEHVFSGDGAGLRYQIGKIPSPKNGFHLVALATPTNQGNNLSAARAQQIQDHFKSITALVMVGIAGGVPNPHDLENHVRLGDVIVSNTKGVLQYDYVKDSGRRRKIRSTDHRPNARLLEATQLLHISDDFDRKFSETIQVTCEKIKIHRPPQEEDVLIDSNDPAQIIPHYSSTIESGRRPGQPKIVFGRIASSNILLKNRTRRDWLRNKYQVNAVEMEGSGIVDATWLNDNGYLIIRGICDYCDDKKNDAWHEYASVAAAAYMKVLIGSMPIPNSPNTIDTFHSQNTSACIKENYAFQQNPRRKISASSVRQNSSRGGILIVTATKVEAQAVHDVFCPTEPRPWDRSFIEGRIYYNLGPCDGVQVHMVQSEMGTAVPGGSLETVSHAIEDLQPQAIIMCGVAFGLHQNKQKLGDILVAQKLQIYEVSKIDALQGEIPRGDRVATSRRLLNQFRSGDNDWNLPDAPKRHFGLVLSGEKLVNNLDFCNKLLKMEKEAIGGEMEGNGLYLAATEHKVDWIVVKAICDWADGNKHDGAQLLAARNAAEFVSYVLRLGGFSKPGQSPQKRCNPFDPAKSQERWDGSDFDMENTIKKLKACLPIGTPVPRCFTISVSENTLDVPLHKRILKALEWDESGQPKYVDFSEFTVGEREELERIHEKCQERLNEPRSALIYVRSRKDHAQKLWGEVWARYKPSDLKRDLIVVILHKGRTMQIQGAIPLPPPVFQLTDANEWLGNFSAHIQSWSAWKEIRCLLNDYFRKTSLGENNPELSVRKVLSLLDRLGVIFRQAIEANADDPGSDFYQLAKKLQEG